MGLDEYENSAKIAELQDIAALDRLAGEGQPASVLEPLGVARAPHPADGWAAPAAAPRPLTSGPRPRRRSGLVGRAASTPRG